MGSSLRIAVPLLFCCASPLSLASDSEPSPPAVGSRASRQLISADIPSKCGKDSTFDKLVVDPSGVWPCLRYPAIKNERQGAQNCKYKENVSWMPAHLEVPYMVYQAERRGMQGMVPHKHSNSAREASAFLMFIAEYYDCLPEITAFVHGHEKSWHSNIPEDLSNLNWDAVGSYLPLSRKYFHNYGPFFWLYPGDPRRHLEIPVARGAEALNGSYSQHEIINGTVYLPNNTYHYWQATDVVIAWETFFEPAGLGPIPKEIRYYCCAQFAVRKETIMRLPREFYLKVIYWSDHSNYKYNPRYTRGLIMETLWHMVMGEPAILPTPLGRECQIYKCNNQTNTATSH